MTIYGTPAERQALLDSWPNADGRASDLSRVMGQGPKFRAAKEHQRYGFANPTDPYGIVVHLDVQVHRRDADVGMTGYVRDLCQGPDARRRVAMCQQWRIVSVVRTNKLRLGQAHREPGFTHSLKAKREAS